MRKQGCRRLFLSACRLDSGGGTHSVLAGSGANPNPLPRPSYLLILGPLRQNHAGSNNNSDDDKIIIMMMIVLMMRMMMIILTMEMIKW